MRQSSLLFATVLASGLLAHGVVARADAADCDQPQDDERWLCRGTALIAEAKQRTGEEARAAYSEGAQNLVRFARQHGEAHCTDDAASCQASGELLLLAADAFRAAGRRTKSIHALRLNVRPKSGMLNTASAVDARRSARADLSAGRTGRSTPMGLRVCFGRSRLGCQGQTRPSPRR